MSVHEHVVTKCIQPSRLLQAWHLRGSWLYCIACTRPGLWRALHACGSVSRVAVDASESASLADKSRCYADAVAADGVLLLHAAAVGDAADLAFVWLMPKQPLACHPVAGGVAFVLQGSVFVVV